MAKIYIIDDDTDLLEILEIWFGVQGFEVVVDYNAEALLKGSEQNATVYLIDINLAGHNGLALISKIQEANKTAKVMMMSANIPDRKKVMDMGAQGFMEKPFDLEKLADSIRSIISVQ